MNTARRRRLVDGALAAAPGLAATWVAHRGSPQIPFAPTALADRVIRLTPGDVATTAIDRLHHAAQQLLAVGLVGTLLAIAAIVSERMRSPGRTALVWTATLLAGGLATPVEPSLPGALAAAAFGGAMYWIALAALRRPTRARRRPRATPVADPDRRRIIASIGASTAVVLVASHPLGRAIGAIAGRPRGLQPDGLPRARVAARPPFPHIARLTREITPAADHYVVDIDINDPVIDGPTWRLHVRGLARRPLELSFADLQHDFAVVEEISVLTCISNRVGGPLVGSSRWEGVRLADLLDRAGVPPHAHTLVVRCADGYSAGIPLAAARHPSALVAIAQDGQALAREHGFPCRLRIPALYGMLNPKWVASIEIVDHPYDGYWAQQGWSSTAVVRTQSRIETPDGARAGQPTWVAGVAWAGIRGVRRVEVSTDDDSTWQDANLHEPLSPWAWTQWAYRWTPPAPGRYTVSCRATDGHGALQDAASRPPHPSGASGYHRIDISVT